jgi:hypothetical protein
MKVPTRGFGNILTTATVAIAVPAATLIEAAAEAATVAEIVVATAV